MGKKLMPLKTKGMNQDLSVSAFNPDFSFENMNLRLSTNEGNTLLSWVNEKGTEKIKIVDASDYDFIISGTPIGSAVINHQLVLFTTPYSGTEPSPALYYDYIYLFYDFVATDNYWKCTGKILYWGRLNFSTKNPIETLVSYEAEHIQKVYWTDNRNQPRLINIADKEAVYTNTSFDFVPAIAPGSNIYVEKYNTGGLFGQGVIQYCYTFINKYGQESNIVGVSSLYYLTHTDRGASPEDNVSNSFKITIKNPDPNFDYVRLYSIQRYSINTTPYVKVLEDLKISEATGSSRLLFYTDAGNSGASMDPTELMYIGGKEILALTMEDKDNTLFLGNITEINTDISPIQQYFNDNRHSLTPDWITFYNDNTNPKLITLDEASGVYDNTFMLNHSLKEISTFKGGDTYRFGFQLQKKDGEWSEPIFIEDAINDKYPRTSIYDTNVTLVHAEGTINLLQFINRQINNADNPYYIENFEGIYTRIRPLIVYPTIQDRSVLCQGVLNPTVFNAMDRKEKMPFAQSSWFFRPYTKNKLNGSKIADTPTIYTPANPSQIVVPSWCSGHTKEVYFMIGEIANNRAATIFSRGYLEYRVHSQGSTSYLNTNIDFWGAVFIENLGTSSRYAFFRDEEWKSIWDYYECQDATHDIYSEDNDPDPNDPTITYKTFKIYDGMYVNSGHLLYYKKGTIGEDTYTFWFMENKTSGGGHNYEVKFYSVTEQSGSPLRFTHYNHVYNGLDDLSEISNSKQLEVQGSTASYISVDSDTPLHNTNTDFFIDQSIVTLNSPELEFDTEVQGYAMEGLKLRIVGAIPITGSVSSHHITTSTSMLPIGYDSEEQETESTTFGTGESDYNVLWNNINLSAGMKLASSYLWNDAAVHIDGEDITTEEVDYDYMVYPWQRTGSLNNDYRDTISASSVLRTKKWANLAYSYNTEYFESHPIDVYIPGSQNPEEDQESLDFSQISSQIHLWENEYVYNLKLAKQLSSTSEVNYYPNIDKVLYNEFGYHIISSGKTFFDKEIYTPISMRYKSGSHAVIALNHKENENEIPILPYAYHHYYDSGTGSYKNCGEYGSSSSINTFWGDTVAFTQDGIETTNLFKDTNATHQPFDFLWLGELYKEVDSDSLFGGKGRNALKNNRWLVCGNAIDIPSTDTSEGHRDVTLNWNEGDTYYQRYDCLKTYAFSPEDTNQVVEILSFMCESHVNLDGRYDKNRGQLDNTDISPQNFNKMNDAYSQENNFFIYSKIGDEDKKSHTYPNWILFSKTKQSGSDVDLWTNITLSSTLDLDGNKGRLNSLQRLNNQLLAFQDTGIAQILYNESAQISTANGVPIEIANSGNVDGKRYLSETIGCRNKWSIANTPSGIYFMDDTDKSIYLFNGQLQNISAQGGFNTWAKKHISYNKDWTPDNFDNFVAYYDKSNQDVLWINKDICLAWSEKLNIFTSFYNYEKAPFFCNLDDIGIWVNKNNAVPSDSYYYLWKHREGQYGNFFGVVKPYWTTLVSNPEFHVDKTFTNLEFRATVEGDGTLGLSGKFTPFLPFDSLESWNEYQHGLTALENKNGIGYFKHYTPDNTSSLKRKFRIWRCDIPRDNAELSTDTILGITRFKKHPLDRMRNPWLYLKLKKNISYYTDEEVEAINGTIVGTVKIGDPIPDTEPTEYYTKEEANNHNSHISGAIMYDGGKPIYKTEVHDLVVTYFD